MLLGAGRPCVLREHDYSPMWLCSHLSRGMCLTPWTAFSTSAWNRLRPLGLSVEAKGGGQGEQWRILQNTAPSSGSLGTARVYRTLKKQYVWMKTTVGTTAQLLCGCVADAQSGFSVSVQMEIWVWSRCQSVCSRNKTTTETPALLLSILLSFSFKSWYTVTSCF